MCVRNTQILLFVVLVIDSLLFLMVRRPAYYTKCVEHSTHFHYLRTESFVRSKVIGDAAFPEYKITSIWLTFNRPHPVWLLNRHAAGRWNTANEENLGKNRFIIKKKLNVFWGNVVVFNYFSNIWGRWCKTAEKYQISNLRHDSNEI